jgi:hypothetical protein
LGNATDEILHLKNLLCQTAGYLCLKVQAQRVDLLNCYFKPLDLADPILGELINEHNPRKTNTLGCSFKSELTGFEKRPPRPNLWLYPSLGGREIESKFLSSPEARIPVIYQSTLDTLTTNRQRLAVTPSWHFDPAGFVGNMNQCPISISLLTV